MGKVLRRTAFAAILAASSTPSACTPTAGQTIDLRGQQVRLTIIHTSDIHSRLLPYEFTPLVPDRAAGLQPGRGPYGGMARVAYVARRERARADRVVHIDGGDVFQGAPIFNYFNGEAEIRALAETGVDAMVISNHEFDRGVQNVVAQIQKWATFPVLAANYSLDPPAFPGNSPLGTVLRPYTILNARGLRIGVIGMGNLSTISSIYEQPNRLGIQPYSTQEIAQFYIDLLRPQVDLVVAVTHLGLENDEEMIRETEGLDVVLGGHNHIVVSPPKQVFDCGGLEQPEGHVEIPIGDGSIVRRACKPRRVLLMHSGAFAKFVGRLDVDVTDDPGKYAIATGRPASDYDPVNGFEVVSHAMQIFPIDGDVPEDRRLVAMLEPYALALKDVGNLDLLVGYAPADVRRGAPAGGDSALGNLIATSMWLRLGVQTDFSMTNTTGIRADIPRGPVTLEQMFNVFPFDNSITKMQLSGTEVFELFDFAARRALTRGCTSQVQIAGAFLVYNCSGCDTTFRPDAAGARACVEQVFIGHDERRCGKDTDCEPNARLSRYACDQAIGRCRTAATRNGSYELATSNYLAGGGSGFRVLQRNTTQFDTKIQQRDAATDYLRTGRPCGWQTGSVASGLRACAVDADCASLGDFVCACPETSDIAGDPFREELACGNTQGRCGELGRCVLATCRDDLARFHDERECRETTGDGRTTCRRRACAEAGEQCKILTCVDASVGAKADGRQVMLGR
jgi:5'-nucleotidase